MAETLLQVKDLIKEYEGNRILDGVNLEIEQGQVVVVVGPSGCGKSTLLRCINALEPIQGGQVILEGKTVGKTIWKSCVKRSAWCSRVTISFHI